MRILYSRIELDPDSIELDESDTISKCNMSKMPVMRVLHTTFLIPDATTYNKIAVELNNSDIAYTSKPIKLIKK